jgi:hypothetical protein
VEAPLGSFTLRELRWDEFWYTLTEFAERFDLVEAKLNIHMPEIGEDYHASWIRKEPAAELELWRTDIPLAVNDVTIGRLSITGARKAGSVCLSVSDVIGELRVFESQLAELLESPDSPVLSGRQPISKLDALITTESDILARNGE